MNNILRFLLIILVINPSTGICSEISFDSAAIITFNDTTITPSIKTFYSKNEEPNLNHLEFSRHYVACIGKNNKTLLYGQRTNTNKNVCLDSIVFKKAPFTCNPAQKVFFASDGLRFGAQEESGNVRFYWNIEDMTYVEHAIKTYNSEYCNIVLNPYKEEYIYTPGNNTFQVTGIKRFIVGTCDWTSKSFTFSAINSIKVLDYYKTDIFVVYCTANERAFLKFFKIFNNNNTVNEAGGFTFSKPTTTPLIAFCASSTLCAFINNNHLVLADLQSLHTPQGPTILKEFRIEHLPCTALFFVRETLIIVGKGVIGFYNTKSNTGYLSSLSAYTYAKWHKLTNELTLTQGDQALIYKFPTSIITQ